ncbi:hypothetical protein BH24ACT15_BH24ACT15_30380 [soil metagenome]
MTGERVVWKFEVPVEGLLVGKLLDPQVIHVAGCGGELPVLWIEHGGLSVEGVVLAIRFVGTGQPIPDDYGRHVGSCVTGSKLVWHVYARQVDQS